MKNLEPGSLQRSLVTAVTVVALGGALGFLFERTRSVDPEGSTEVISLLRQLKQLDTGWSVDVLRAKTDLANHDDSVADPQPLIAALQARLGEGTDGAWADAPGRAHLAPMLAALSATMDQKIEPPAAPATLQEEISVAH